MASTQTTQSADTMLVRIRPVKSAKGPKVERYMYQGTRYDAARGWYEVPPETAQRLKRLRQDHYDPDSAVVFDVCTPDEAQQVEEAEARRAERATAARPNVTDRRDRGRRKTGGTFTSRDLERAKPSRRAELDDDLEMLDPDPEGSELEDDGLVSVGRVQPVPPDESHDGDRGVHAYRNVKPERHKKSNLPPPDESHDGDRGVHAYTNDPDGGKAAALAARDGGSIDNPVDATDPIHGEEQSSESGARSAGRTRGKK